MTSQANLKALLDEAVRNFNQARAKNERVYGDKPPARDPRYEGLNECRKNVIKANAKINKVTYCIPLV